MALQQEEISKEGVAERDRKLDIEAAALETTRPDIFAAFILWSTVPSLLRYPPKNKDGTKPTPREFAESMGIEDEEILKLIDIKTQGQFAEKYGIGDSTVYRWKKKAAERDVLMDIRKWAQPLTRNVILSLYNKAIRGGLPDHYKLFLQAIPGWSEKIRIDQRTIKKVIVEVVDARDAEPPKEIPFVHL